MGRYSDVNILRNRKPNQTPGPRYYQGVKYLVLPHLILVMCMFMLSKEIDMIS